MWFQTLNALRNTRGVLIHWDVFHKHSAQICLGLLVLQPDTLCPRASFILAVHDLVFLFCVILF